MTRLNSILLFLFLLGTSLFAQQNTKVLEYSVVNWGFKVGLNALSSSHYQVYYNDVELENSTIKNKVGYSGTLFLRINLSNFYMQPEASWNYFDETCSFIVPPSSNNYQGKVNISINENTGNVNVLAGYNIIKEGPYLFNVFVGPGLKYTYHTNYAVSKNTKFEDQIKRYDLNGIVGFSLQISKLYFDFRYEVSRFNTKIDFKEIENTPNYLNGIIIDKNENILGFSCGMMF